MTDLPERRTYSRDEITDILRRATELQGSAGDRSGAGLTLDELRQLARDVDIDPRFVEAAAFELARGDDPAVRTLMGGPLTLTLRRSVQGPVSNESFARMVTAARRSFGQSGQSSEVGNIREWTAGSPGAASYSFSLTERDGGTDLEVFWAEGILAVPFIVIPLILCLIALGVIFGELAPGLAGIPIYAAWVAVVLGSARLLFGTIASKRRRSIADLVDRLASIAESDRQPSATAQARRTHGPRTESGASEPITGELPPVEEPQHVRDTPGPGRLGVLGPLVDDEPEILPGEKAPGKQRVP